MAGLTLTSITCNKINSITVGEITIILGGPIELRAPINPGPTTLLWGAWQMQAGETINFNTLPAAQQPQPTPINFFNPIWIEIWDTGIISQISQPPTAVASTTQINPWDLFSSGEILTYLGGEYELKYVLNANFIELTLAYSIAVVNLFIKFFVITFQFLRSLPRSIVSLFRPSRFDRQD